MKMYWQLILVSVLLFSGIDRVFAVPPPDFIFAVGSSLGVIFTFVVVIFSSVLGAAATLARSFFGNIPHKKIFWSIIAFIVVALSLGIGMYADSIWQSQQYEQWKQESAKNTGPVVVTREDISTLDQTAAFSELTPLTSNSPVSSFSSSSIAEIRDPNIQFINKYYTDIQSGNFDEAYAVSKKSVSLETFKGWYKTTTNISVDFIQAIREDVYSVGLTLREGEIATRYSVLMTLQHAGDGSTSIAESLVKVVPAEESSAPVAAAVFEGVTQTQAISVDQMQVTQESVTHDEFKAILAREAPFVLDAREDEEFEIGRLPGSVHIRFANLLAGEWVSIPNDKEVYVFCWSGIRGKEVADFLRSKNIIARYIEGGADGWVTSGGIWEGGIKFSSKYTDERYQVAFSTQQTRAFEKEGVMLVDSRPKSTYDQWHIPGSVNVPIIYTPTIQMDEVLRRVPENLSVITVCDDFVSCFDAKVTGVKLEKMGHTFLGRYNKPWEYRANP